VASSFASVDSCLEFSPVCCNVEVTPLMVDARSDHAGESNFVRICPRRKVLLREEPPRPDFVTDDMNSSRFVDNCGISRYICGATPTKYEISVLGELDNSLRIGAVPEVASITLE
jgi:hypothetical protein